MEQEETRVEPVEITTFVADDAELIDPNWNGGNQPVVPRRPRKWLPLFLFVATCFSTCFAYTVFIGGIPASGPTLSTLLPGLKYSAAVLSILMAHEMGHYLAARFHRVPASLPYFIPMPISPLGTMGAVIVQGRGVADRRQMFDIAVAGPLAGLVLALPVLWLGVERATIQASPRAGEIVFGMPLLVKFMFEHARPELMEAGKAIADNPLLMAGWVGIFVTALNLIPIGQLDGGHILYCMIGRRAHRVAMGLLLFAVGWMVYTSSPNYILLIVLLFVFGPKHPPTANDAVPLGPLRVALGWLTLAFIVIGFTPNPIS
jgi:membrane-associated protease RseP (regulator of RpoE activity)